MSIETIRPPSGRMARTIAGISWMVFATTKPPARSRRRIKRYPSPSSHAGLWTEREGPTKRSSTTRSKRRRSLQLDAQAVEAEVAARETDDLAVDLDADDLGAGVQRADGPPDAARREAEQKDAPGAVLRQEKYRRGEGPPNDAGQSSAGLVHRGLGPVDPKLQPVGDSPYLELSPRFHFRRPLAGVTAPCRQRPRGCRRTRPPRRGRG
jgi:hypothetical protein